MAKAPMTIARVAVDARGPALLALIAASETGFLMLTQDEGAEAVSAGHAVVDTSIAPEGDLAAVRLTDAGAALLNPVASAPAATGFDIDDNVPMPVVTRRPRETAYPFDKLQVGQSFHVAPTVEFPDPVSRLYSSVSGARAKWSVPTGEKEIVKVKEYMRVEGGKGYVKGEDGKRIVIGERDEERDVTTPTRDFKVVAVDASDPRGAGARVYRIA